MVSQITFVNICKCRIFSLFYFMWKLNYVLEVLCEQKLSLEDKLSPYYQHGFLRSEENVIYNIPTLKMALVL